MSLKDFNYKQFFFDHGERIGVAVAGFIALCLVLPLFWPGSGFLSASAGANAENLESLAKHVDDGIRTNQPGPADKPDDPTAKLVSFDFKIIPDAGAKDYMVASMYYASPGGAGGRQMPLLKQPKESSVALVRFQLPSLMFTDNYEKLMTLKDAAAAGPAVGMTGSGMNNEMMIKMYGKGSMSGVGAPASLQGPGGEHIKKRHSLISAGAGDDKNDKDFPLEAIALDKISGKKLAEMLYPLRAAEIVAAFPYKEQVREFKEKLHLGSDAEVLTEFSREVSKDGKQLTAFRFLGLNVQRREIDANGAPVGGKEGWMTPDLDGSYKALIVLNGKRLEDEDPKLRPLIFPGLVMKKLVTFGARRKPPVDEYPKIEEELPSLKATEDLLSKSPDVKVIKPSLTNVPEDIYNLDSSGGAPPGGATFPGGSAPPGGSTPPPGVTMPPGAVGLIPDGSAKPGQEFAIPDVCLIRLFDVTVEAGKTYEYRIQVRMANPNFGRKDSASQAYADVKELPSNDWYVLPQKVTVPSDLHYYAVDQKEPKDRDPKEPRLPIQAVKDGQTVLQIQKWVDYLPPTKARGVDLPVGEWLVAERVVASRGEPIGKQKTEVPYWRTTQDRFTMASDKPQPSSSDPKPKIPPTVEVPFAPEGQEPILVDFSGGDVTYRRSHPKTEEGAPAGDQPLAVPDKAPMEAVLLTADGRLVAHNAAHDAADPERVKRLEEAREWIQAVKNMKGGKNDDANPFPKMQ